MNIKMIKEIYFIALKGTGQLVFGNYGRLEDFQRLRKSQLALKGSIALIRFGTIHPSAVVRLFPFFVHISLNAGHEANKLAQHAVNSYCRYFYTGL